jgi:HlyD family secretion protein
MNSSKSSSLLIASLLLGLIAQGCSASSGGASPTTGASGAASPVSSASPDSASYLMGQAKNRRVSASARLEPADQIVHLQAAAPRQSDRIASLYVREGEQVKKGQLLARLDGLARLQRDWESAQARVLQAEARLEQVLAGAKNGEVERQRAEVQRIGLESLRQRQVLDAQISRLELEERQALRNHERYQKLFRDGACSRFEAEQKQLAWETARQQVEQTRREVRKISDTYSVQKQSAQGELNRIQEIRPADVESARADIAQAQAEARRIRAEQDDCEIKAPRTGVILKIRAREGEKIGSEGLLDLAGTQHMVAIAEVHQNDVGKLRLNQSCSFTSPALKEPLRGKIARFEPQVKRQNIFSDKPGEQFDQRVVEVRVALDGASNNVAGQWTNLQLEAAFED